MTRPHLIDTHTHLDSKEFDQDRDEVIKRALEAGVTKMITIGASDGLESAKRAIELAERFSFIWCTVGVHPHDAGKCIDWEELRALARHPKVVAIGETGLDFYRDWAPKDKQYEYFVEQIKIAKEVSKPIVIHSRDAGAECLRILIENEASRVGGIFHCYAEDAGFAKKLREISFKVSIPGVVTFKKSIALRETLKEIPLEQIFLETDAPYLAPEPLRGKRCEPSLITKTAEAVASVMGLSLEEFAAETTKNATEFFKLY